MKLTQRETILLWAFGSLFVLLAGGGLVFAGIRALSGVMEGNSSLTQRAAKLQMAVDDRAIWESRDQWLNEHTDTFQSREDAAAALLNHIETCAQNADMALIGREIVDSGNTAGRTEEDEEEPVAYFRTATIRVKVSGPQEKVLGWMHALQQPERLIGVTAEIIEAGEEFTAEIDVTKSYFEGS